MNEPPGRALVTIVIVNFNGKEVLPECLRGVSCQDYPSYEVVLVDNASSDGSLAAVELDFPIVRIVRSPVNLGFAGGSNLGFKEARGEYVALLNSDTVPEVDWLTRLVDGLERRNLTVASSTIVTEGVPPEEYEMNGTINYLGYNLPREFSDLETLFYCSAAALLLRRAAVDELFPDFFFLYQEDLHLSWKSRLRGNPLGMVPESKVAHRGSFSTARLQPPVVAYYQERNRLLNCLVFYEPWTLVRLVPYFVLDGLAKLLLGFFGRGKPPGAVVRAYGGVLARVEWIVATRREIKRTRTVVDREILSLMTYRVVRAGGVLGNTLNGVSRLYARIAGLSFHA